MILDFNLRIYICDSRDEEINHRMYIVEMTRLLGSSGRSTLESSTTLLSLDRREPGKLVLGHADSGTTLESVGSSAQEAGSVGVQRLVS